MTHLKGLIVGVANERSIQVLYVDSGYNIRD